MLDVLYKKAKGYEIEEINREYVVDEDGNQKLVKEKTTTKHIPPDLSALKTYMELKDSELTKMSTEELKKERMRLLKELKNSDRRKGKDGAE